MSRHETHQIYFERYLRKLMSPDERQEFEDSLQADPELAEALQQYKFNRKKHLRELFDQERVESRSSWRQTHTIYLLISLISISLSVYYYLDYQELRNRFQNFIHKTTALRRDPGVLTINKPTPEIQYPLPADTMSETEIPDAPADFYTSIPSELTENPSVQEDQLLQDTLMHVIQWITDDSLAIGNEQLRVQLWYSPIGFVGYRFHQNTVQVFGPDDFRDIVIYTEKGDFWMRYKNRHFLLTNDNNYYKF